MYLCVLKCGIVHSVQHSWKPEEGIVVMELLNVGPGKFI